MSNTPLVCATLLLTTEIFDGHASYMPTIAFSVGLGIIGAVPCGRASLCSSGFKIFRSVPVYIPTLSLCTAASEGDM